MDFKEFYKKYFILIEIIYIIIGTFIMFYALYFSDKPTSIKTLRENIDNPMMYLCLIISLVGSLWISKSISSNTKNKSS